MRGEYEPQNVKDKKVGKMACLSFLEAYSIRVGTCMFHFQRTRSTYASPRL